MRLQPWKILQSRPRENTLTGVPAGLARIPPIPPGQHQLARSRFHALRPTLLGRTTCPSKGCASCDTQPPWSSACLVLACGAQTFGHWQTASPEKLIGASRTRCAFCQEPRRQCQTGVDLSPESAKRHPSSSKIRRPQILLFGLHPRLQSL